MIQPLFVFYDWALLALRIVLGVMLVVRGLPRLKDLKAAGKRMDASGFKPGIFWATVAGIVEFAGGLCIVAGFLTQFAALLVLLESLVAAMRAKRVKRPSGSCWLNALVAATALLLMTTGGGLWSIEQTTGTFIFY